MKFLLFSDIHGGTGYYHASDYSDVVLIIAGDFDEAKKSRYSENIKKLAPAFKSVILVAGNHEYYGSNIFKTNKVLKELETEVPNFTYLNDNHLWIDDVLIVGGTLWTDFDGSSPITKIDARLKMNDYKHIRNGPPSEPWRKKLSVEDVEFMHYKTKKYIRDAVDNERTSCHNDFKVVVVTHHAPSFKSVSPKYQNNSLNGCYCSNMDEYVEALGADVWIHGHVHNSFDYNIGKTRIICNPRGYETYSGGVENFDYNPKFIFEV
jgi:predicted phosphodiesterase